MDPKDLLKMLDLDGKPPDTPSASGMIAADATEPAPPTDASPTALQVDAWGLRRGRDLVAESDRLKKAGTDEFAAADFFSCAFDPDPKLAAECTNYRRHQFVAQLLDTPEYHALHASTRLDDTAAGIAATHFAEQFAQLRKEDTKECGGSAAGSGDAPGDEMATLRAVGRAVAEAGRWPRPGKRSASCTKPPPRSAWGRARPRATTRGPWPRCSSESAATPRSGGSASWPVSSGGWPRASSG